MINILINYDHQYFKHISQYHPEINCPIMELYAGFFYFFKKELCKLTGYMGSTDLMCSDQRSQDDNSHMQGQCVKAKD